MKEETDVRMFLTRFLDQVWDFPLDRPETSTGVGRPQDV